MTKTIKQWFEEWGGPDAHFALEYAEKDENLEMERESLSEALSYAFDWSSTTEGNAYWRAIYDQQRSEEAKQREKNEQ